MNFTLPVNKWVEYCSLTPVPSRGSSCSQAGSEAEYRGCLQDFCPFLVPFMEQVRNFECIQCLTTPVPGESRISRIFKCSATYIDTDAVNCRVLFPANPQSVTVLAGNSATFKASSLTGAPETVQWEVSTDGGQNFSPVPGGDAAAYTVTAASSMNGNQYRAVFTEPVNLTTQPATLTVLTATPPATQLLVSNGAGLGMVDQFNGVTGAFVSNLAPVDAPAGIVVDRATGSLFVASTVLNQVLKLNRQTGAPDGVFVNGGAACGGSPLNRPAGLAFGPDEHLYVVDSGGNRVVRYDGQTGACMNTFASGSTLNQPHGLAFGNDGRLYVANLSGTVARFTSGGIADGSIALGTAPAGLAIGPLDGQLYVSDRVAEGRILKVSTTDFTTATPTVFVTPAAGGLVNPDGLAFGFDNHLYAANSGTSQIRKFDGITGALLETLTTGLSSGFVPRFLAFSAPATVSANAANVTFSPSNQNVTLSASVTRPGGTVNSGTVVFTVVDTSGPVATQIGSSTSPVSVSSGTASTTFVLPGGTTAGTYSIRAAYSGTKILRSASDSTNLLTVGKATPTVTWNTPASIPFGSALSGTQLNATANMAGTFVYTPPAGTVLPAGNGRTLFVQFNPTNSQNYNAVTQSVQINVTAGGPATLVSTSTLTREPGTNNVRVTMTIANTGGSTATGVAVNTARIGAINALTALPVSIANIPAGGTATVTLAFPPSVGAAGARVVVTTSGTFAGGSFGQSARVVLP
jgi:sugar lactone lactonase YvrE